MPKKSKTKKYIDRYGLKIVSIIKIDLRRTHMQYRIDDQLDELLKVDGVVDRSMLNSPHYKLACLYFNKGREWCETNFKDTDYFKLFNKVLGRVGNVPFRKFDIFDSIKDGYLRDGFDADHIVVLEKPLIISRYGVEDIHLDPMEIFIGHHRASALLALGRNIVDVIIVEDSEPGTCNINGKLSNNYRKIL